MSVSIEPVSRTDERQTQERPEENEQTIDSKKVAIIGGGLSGLICARECLREGHRVSIFEKKKDIGGTWSYEKIATEFQIKDVFDDDWPSLTRSVQSSLFDNLRLNLPREIMGFSDFPFDDKFEGSQDSRRYCDYEEAARYIKAFSRFFDLEQHIQLESEVINVELFDSDRPQWNLEVKCGGTTRVHEFDAVVVSNGQYTVPNIPDVKNIDRFENLCLHSHLYRNADPFQGKRVVVRGGNFSGRDIGLEIGTVAKSVFICSRTYFEGTDISKPLGIRKNVHLMADITECTGKGAFELKDGSVLENVDVLIFCTGYRYEFPFLEKSGLVRTDEGFVYPVYRHIFHPHHPTLAFMTLPDRILASAIAEFQSKYIARVFSGRCHLPDAKTMIDVIDRSIEEHRQQYGNLENYHHLDAVQFEYMKALAESCGDVKPVSEWREPMIFLAMDVLVRYPDDFRDREINDPCFDQAKQEIDAIRELLNAKS